MPTYKYLVAFIIPQPYSREICKVMDHITNHTGVKPPYHKLLPHVTFHEPITGIDEIKLQQSMESLALQMKYTRLVLHALFPFGKKYIVLPAQATKEAARLWIGIHTLLSCFPGCTDNDYAANNTLHVTVAENLTHVFDVAWEHIRKNVPVTPMEIPLERISLCRKPIEKGTWEEACSFPLST